jgi:hypothetical protein
MRRKPHPLSQAGANLKKKESLISRCIKSEVHSIMRRNTLPFSFR